MELVLTGHDYKYAAEQILMSVFPDERPEYGDTAGASRAVISLHRGDRYTTAAAKIDYNGRTARGTAKVENAALTDALTRDSKCQMIVKLAFYRAALKLLPEKPAWGAVTGIRPGTLFTKMVEDGLTEAAARRRMMRLYDIDKERAALLADTSRASLAVKGGLMERDIAVYVGIPFCPTRCAYCSFVSQSIERSMGMIPPFLAALRREITAVADEVRALGLRVIAVYIGGGTPTTLSAGQLAELIGHLRAEFDFSHVREFSVEAGRPDTITPDKLAALEAGGVTRISVNPQSMADEVLAAIGRSHSADEVRAAYALAREKTSADVNMDVIAGLPADTPARFADTLRELIAMEPENITVHTLALKKGTRITLEGAALPAREDVAAMLAFAREALTQAGYRPYYMYRQKFMSGGFENIGWAKPGKESLYNILIMEELCTILAAGGGASTKLVDTKTGRVQRIFDYKYPKEYIEGIDKLIADKAKIADFYQKGDN